MLLPGFVNAHTHLELHGLRDIARDDDFFAWLQHVRRLKASSTPEEFLEAARAGVREAWRFGATTVADTGTSGAAVTALTELGGRGTYYHEVIAPEPARKDEALAEARRALRRLTAIAGDRVRLGVSPHAPYTVSPELAGVTAAFAREAGLPLAAHVAESEPERAFLARHEGPFAELWRRRRIALPPRSASPVRYVAERGLLGPDLLAIHVVQADADDLQILAGQGVAVAACPRSNRRHGHGDPPLAAMFEAGLTVGLGTDSAASVGSLDLLAEARLARTIAGCTAERAVRMLTIDGARAVGISRDAGSLEAGKWADACVVRLAELPDDPERLADAILEAGSAGIVATWVGGQRVYDAAM